MSTIQKEKMATANFTNSKTVQARPDFYTTVNLDIAATLKSWKLSVFSYEWIDKDGAIKNIDALKESDQQKRRDVENSLKTGQALDMPVLGIGIQDNVEIGSGKAVLCTLAAHGVQTIPVHIPKSNESDFKAFIADVK